MNEIKQLQNELESLLIKVAEYNNVKKTKTISGKIRAELGELKKKVTGYRADLVNLDRAGY